MTRARFKEDWRSSIENIFSTISGKLQNICSPSHFFCCGIFLLFWLTSSMDWLVQKKISTGACLPSRLGERTWLSRFWIPSELRLRLQKQDLVKSVIRKNAPITKRKKNSHWLKAACIVHVLAGFRIITFLDVIYWIAVKLQAPSSICFCWCEL